LHFAHLKKSVGASSPLRVRCSHQNASVCAHFGHVTTVFGKLDSSFSTTMTSGSSWLMCSEILKDRFWNCFFVPQFLHTNKALPAFFCGIIILEHFWQNSIFIYPLIKNDIQLDCLNTISFLIPLGLSDIYLSCLYTAGESALHIAGAESHIIIFTQPT